MNKPQNCKQITLKSSPKNNQPWFTSERFWFNQDVHKAQNGVFVNLIIVMSLKLHNIMLTIIK